MDDTIQRQTSSNLGASHCARRSARRELHFRGRPCGMVSGPARVARFGLLWLAVFLQDSGGGFTLAHNLLLRDSAVVLAVLIASAASQLLFRAFDTDRTSSS